MPDEGWHVIAMTPWLQYLAMHLWPRQFTRRAVEGDK